MRIANVLRYNSPSKRQIRRLAGRPKSLKKKAVVAEVVAPEPIKYTTKEEAPFAVAVEVVDNLLGYTNLTWEESSCLFW